MAKLKMNRLEMVALLSDSHEIIDILQRKGIVEFSKVDFSDGFAQVDTKESISIYEKKYRTATLAAQVMEAYTAKEKKSLLAAFSGKKELSCDEYYELSSKADRIMEDCEDIIRLSRELENLKAETVRYETLIDGLNAWKSLDVPMLYSKTASTAMFIGSAQKPMTRADILSGIAQKEPELDGVEVEVVATTKEQTCIFAVCYKDDADRLYGALRAIGFSKPSNMTRKRPADVIEDYKHEIGAAKLKSEALTKQLKSYTDIKPEIDFLCDYYQIQCDKYDALKNLGLTANTFFVKGFIPEKYARELKQELEASFCVYVLIEEPEEDEDVPVLLENNSFAGGVEGITEMYSQPGKNDVDPNPVMSFFYYALFGIMLSDAGYGVIMVLVTFLAKKKLKLSTSMKKSMDMFFYCGISTVIWGALFGGWFGDAVPVIARNFFGREIGSIALWFEPVSDAMRLLLYSFLFGIIHLFAGLAVRFYSMCKQKDPFGAICDVVPVYVFVTGFAIMGAGLITTIPQNISVIGKYLLLAGALLIVLTSGRSSKNIVGKLGGGLYGLYNAASGYLGDILSYSRLLALSLVTGVIANVVNMLGTMPQNMVLKVIMFIPVFILGHTLNIAINLIGTYVHTNRLQYVEFFSKFYEGGGRSFTPFSVKTKHYNIKEETYNG